MATGEANNLPKIMYDQTQFTAVYLIDGNGLYISDGAYKKMEKISGYSPETWSLYSQLKPEPFFFGAYDGSALEKEAEIGLKNFSNKKFFKRFENAAALGYKKCAELKNVFFKNFFGREKEMLVRSPSEVSDFLNRLRKTNEYLMSYYFLTQPQRFFRIKLELEKYRSNEETAFIAANGRRLTYVSCLRKAMVVYASNVLGSSFPPEKYKMVHSEEYGELLRTVGDLGFLNRGIFGGEYLDENNIDREIKLLVDDKEKLRIEKKNIDTLVSSLENRKNILKENSSRAFVLADLIGHTAVLRFDIQTCLLAMLKYADCIIRAAAAQNGLSADDIDAYGFDELVDLIKTGNKISADLVSTRQNGYLRVFRHDSIRTYLADEAREKIGALIKFRKKEIEQTKKITGTVASRPDKSILTIKGTAFVLTTAFGADESVKAMRPGSILFATQTHPNLVPYMKKALAIVTDEGGVTCHAAIVSREIGKPCIIGTRLATKVVKTGDKVALNLKTGEIDF